MCIRDRIIVKLNYYLIALFAEHLKKTINPNLQFSLTELGLRADVNMRRHMKRVYIRVNSLRKRNPSFKGFSMLVQRSVGWNLN